MAESGDPDHRGVDIAVGATSAALALIALLVWIPSDTATGFLEVGRRRVALGDAMMPTLAALILGGMGVLLLVRAWRRRPPAPDRVDRPAPRWWRLSHGAWPAQVMVIALGLLLMYVLGPLAVGVAAAFGWEVGPYRVLIATPPWNLIGFVLGGTVIVFGLILLAEGRPSRGALVTALLSTIGMVGLYNGLFDTLLLPPNGDF